MPNTHSTRRTNVDPLEHRHERNALPSSGTVYRAIEMIQSRDVDGLYALYKKADAGLRAYIRYRADAMNLGSVARFDDKLVYDSFMNVARAHDGDVFAVPHGELHEMLAKFDALDARRGAAVVAGMKRECFPLFAEFLRGELALIDGAWAAVD